MCSISLRRAPSLVWPNSCFERGELVADDGRDARRRGQDVEQVGDLRPSPPCTRRRSCPAPGRSGAAGASAGSRWPGRRTAGTGRRPAGRSAAAGPRAGRRRGRRGVSLPARASISRTIDESQLLLISAALATGGVGEALIDRDELVDVGQRHRQAFEHVAALARLAQLEHGAPRDHLAPVLEEDLDQVASGCSSLRLAVDQRDHVDAEACPAAASACTGC